MTNSFPNEQLTAFIQQEIVNHHGYLSFARFMELALYTPTLGYYMRERSPFGKSGDFITAPDISPLFAQCVANQCQPILEALDGGEIVELGAGSGHFANVLLLQLEKLDCLPNRYLIIEISPALRLHQQALFKKECPHLLPLIEWLPALPSNRMKGIIFANEVIDALPVHCFQVESDCIYERCVTWKHHQFEWCLRPPTSSILLEKTRQIAHDYDLPIGYKSEIRLTVSSWIKSLADALQQGLILLMDYGYGRPEYYRPDRSLGTLMCFHQHRQHDNPFLHVGTQDMTAHVDFTSVAETALANQLQLQGYTTQAAFLLNLGLLTLASHSSLSEVQRYQDNQAIKKLTLPSQMGEIIKAMALSKDLDLPLLGFSAYDRRQNL